MTNVAVTQQINAPPEAVFALITDLEGLPARISSIKKIEKFTPGPVGNGTRFRETRVMFGKEATEEMTFTEFDPPRGYTLLAASHGSKYTTVHRLEPSAGGTKLTIDFGAEPVSMTAKVVGVLMGWMMKGMIRKCLQQDLDALKTAAEKTKT